MSHPQSILADVGQNVKASYSQPSVQSGQPSVQSGQPSVQSGQPSVQSGTSPVAQSSILHVDVDAFFVQMELKRHPELRGLPVVVGNPSRRGVVAAASYEARGWGVFSATPSLRASRMCPDLIFLKGDIGYYAAASSRIMEILFSFTPDVEQVSIDEAFLDVSGSGHLFGSPTQIAWSIRQQVEQQEGILCSIGVGPNKLIAKLASKSAKPKPAKQNVRPGEGVLVIQPSEVKDFLYPRGVADLFGVGAATEKALHKLGVRTVAELAEIDESVLVRSLGKARGRHLAKLAQGIDSSSIEVSSDLKSASHEITFPEDLHTHQELRAVVWELTEKVSARLRKGGLYARGVSIKIRFGDFTTFVRSMTMDIATQTTQDIAEAAIELLGREDVSAGVRLLGVGAEKLESCPPQQMSLLDTDHRKQEGLDKVMDAIRSRHGVDSIRRAINTQSPKPHAN